MSAVSCHRLWDWLASSHFHSLSASPVGVVVKRSAVFSPRLCFALNDKHVYYSKVFFYIIDFFPTECEKVTVTDVLKTFYLQKSSQSVRR